MKAAVMYQNGQTPKVVELPTPIPENPNQLLMNVEAVAVKHIDRSRATGKHYSTVVSETDEGTIIGGDGIGMLHDGTRVYALGVSGMAAEYAIIDRTKMVRVPATLDVATAAALPNGVIGAAMALLFRARVTPGEIVLINGATGFTGRIAVQLAKHYGAKVIATGRNTESLKSLIALGADEVIALTQDDDALVMHISELNRKSPIDVIIDYLWGHSAELLLAAIKGKGSFTHPLRFVSVGSMTGDTIQLKSEVLRSVNLQLSGSGLGSWTREEVGKLISEILPEMFQLAADGKLKIETTQISLAEIESAYNITVADGKRLVVKLS